MQPHDWIDLGTLVVSILVVIAGAVWAIPRSINGAFASLVEQIGKVEELGRLGRKDLHNKIESTANSLDGKYNTVRDSIDVVKATYARRDDLEGAVARVERATGELKEDIAALAERMDRAVGRFTETVTNLAVQVAKREKAS